MEFDDYPGPEEEQAADPVHDRAVEELRGFFESNKETVFFGRQLEVLHERRYFHWITNRATHQLLELGDIQGEWRRLRTGASIHLLWHRTFRYYRRAAKKVVGLVDEYAATNIGAALGLQGEMLCNYLGLRPVFAVRMIPKTWVNEVVKAGGFALIMGYQLYPWGHRDLAQRVQREFRLPVDSPRSLEEGTMKRFLRWHEKQR